MMMAMRLLRWVAVGFVFGMALGVAVAQAPGLWDHPAAVLAEQIASILGPGQARLTLRNLSTVSNDDLPAIRKSIEQDLKAHGVTVSDDDSANSIRVTLSENARERLWVAEVVEGNTTRVAMVEAGPDNNPGVATGSGLRLRAESLFSSREPILAALESANGLIVLESGANRLLPAREQWVAGAKPHEHWAAAPSASRSQGHLVAGWIDGVRRMARVDRVHGLFPRGIATC